MPSSLSHTRKFIILKKEFSNMYLNNAKGHCKLEIKGIRGIVNINIEEAQKDNFYNVLLLSNNSHYPVLDLGKVYTDNTGKGKEEFIFFERDLEAKGFFLDELSGVVVANENLVLLAGYLGKEDGRIEEYINTLSQETAKEEFVEIPKEKFLEAPEEELIEEKGFHILEESREVELPHLNGLTDEEINIENPENDEDEDIKEELKLNELIMDQEADEVVFNEDFLVESEDMENVLEEEHTSDIEIVEADLEILAEEHIADEDIVSVFNTMDFVELHESPEEEEDESSEFLVESTNVIVDNVEELNLNDRILDVENIKDSNQRNQTIDYVLSILRFFPYVEPFKYENKGYNWWIIEIYKENNYRAYLPYLSHIIGGNNKQYYSNEYISSNQLINRYQHYLFGLYNEGDSVKYFVYGIPGKFKEMEHPYGGLTGFNTWYEGKFTDGYWILYVDPATGEVIHPQIPMIPIE